MEFKQLDLFGNETAITVNTRSYPKGTMQNRYGILENKTCGTCANCIAYEHDKRIRHKCTVCDPGQRNATRPKNQACKKYMERFD